MAQSSTRFTNIVTRAATVFGQEPDFITIPTSSFEFHWGSSLFLNELHTVDFLIGLDNIRTHVSRYWLTVMYVDWLSRVTWFLPSLLPSSVFQYPPLNYMYVTCVTWCLVSIGPCSHSSRRKADAILMSLLELDTGASVTVIPENIWGDQLDLVPLQESDVPLKSYSAPDIPVVGDSTSSLLGVGEFIYFKYFSRGGP